jgi:hypothetical protein
MIPDRTLLNDEMEGVTTQVFSGRTLAEQKDSEVRWYEARSAME